MKHFSYGMPRSFKKRKLKTHISHARKRLKNAGSLRRSHGRSRKFTGTFARKHGKRIIPRTRKWPNLMTAPSSKRGPVMRYGRKLKTSSSFIKRVLDAQVPRQTWDAIASGNISAAQNQCNWYFGTLNSNFDLDKINTTYLNNFPTGRYLIEDSSSRTCFTNISNVNCFGKIYEFIARRDVPNSLTSPINTFITGLGQVSNLPGGGGGAPAYTNLDVTLFDSPLFCSYFKVLRTKSFSLSPGAELPVIQKSGTKLINMPIIFNSGAFAIRGITRFFALQFWGAVNTSTEVGGQVAISLANLDYVGRNKYTFKPQIAAPIQANYTQALSTIIAADCNTVNPLTGVIDILANA
nr:MAG: capsid protein [Cressdnaviricota sp.]